jgi:hypothetical protein
VEYDHWHSGNDDEGRPYQFTTASQLIADFEAEVKRLLADLGIDDTVVASSDGSEWRSR